MSFPGERRLRERQRRGGSAGFPITDQPLRSIPIPDAQGLLHPLAAERPLDPDKAGTGFVPPELVLAT